ncbi:helix-turn-helix domain-containing protein [Vagococcus teuberi]
MYFGTFIKNQRIIKEKSQKEVAVYLGVRRQSISKWENNVAYPSLEHLFYLSECLDLSLEDMLRHLHNSLSSRKGGN